MNLNEADTRVLLIEPKLQAAGSRGSQVTRSIGQVNVNGKKLQAMPIPVPPLSEQRRIVEYLESIQTQVTKLQRIQSASAAEVERLGRAILVRAFRGGL